MHFSYPFIPAFTHCLFGYCCHGCCSANACGSGSGFGSKVLVERSPPAGSRTYVNSPGGSCGDAACCSDDVVDVGDEDDGFG